MMKTNMSYFRSKVAALRKEYSNPDKVSIVHSKGGKCELCGRKEGDKYVFGPTHYIKKHIVFKVHIHIHVIKSGEDTHKVCVCDGCHLSYHLFNRLDHDAMFGNRTIKNTLKSEGTYDKKYIVAKRKPVKTTKKRVGKPK